MGYNLLQRSREHLSACEDQTKTRVTAAVRREVEQYLELVRRREQWLNDLCLPACPPAFVGLSKRPRGLSYVVDELTEVLSRLEKQQKREEIASGWESYFNVYGGAGNNMQALGRHALSEFMDSTRT